MYCIFLDLSIPTFWLRVDAYTLYRYEVAGVESKSAGIDNAAEVEVERTNMIKRLKKVRAAMKKLPSKEERSEEETAKYKKLKKEAMRLMTLVSSASGSGEL